MKTKIIFFIIIAFICSCNNEDNLGSDVVYVRIRVMIVDEELNDRLNPESPSYLGDEYIQNISVGYRAIREDNDNVLIESFEQKQPVTYRNGTRQQYIYFIWCSPYAIDYRDEDNEDYKDLGWSVCKYPTYTDIYYPDGSVDEIKSQFRYSSGDNGSVLTISKIWVNDELAYEFGYTRERPPYYNPEYYPWLKPMYDTEGNFLYMSEDTCVEGYWIVLRK